MEDTDFTSLNLLPTKYLGLMRVKDKDIAISLDVYPFLDFDCVVKHRPNTIEMWI